MKQRTDVPSCFSLPYVSHVGSSLRPYCYRPHSRHTWRNIWILDFKKFHKPGFGLGQRVGNHLMSESHGFLSRRWPFCRSAKREVRRNKNSVLCADFIHSFLLDLFSNMMVGVKHPSYYHLHQSADPGEEGTSAFLFNMGRWQPPEFPCANGLGAMQYKMLSDRVQGAELECSSRALCVLS